MYSDICVFGDAEVTHINIVSRLEMVFGFFFFYFVQMKCCVVSLKALPELESAFLKGIFCVFPY